MQPKHTNRTCSHVAFEFGGRLVTYGTPRSKGQGFSAFLVVLMMANCTLYGSAQSSSGTQGQTTSRATQLPPSGQSAAQQGAVITQQQTVPGGDTNAVQTTVQVSGSYQGSVADRTVLAGAMHLTLKEAIRRSLNANLGKLAADLSVKNAGAQVIEARSPLLPNVAATVTENETQVNLAVYGLNGLTGGLPSVIGPFSYFQAQATYNESLLDFVQINNLRASRDTHHAAELNARNSREMVILATAASYLQVVATDARFHSQEAQTAYSEAVYKQASARLEAGTNTRIDVNRSFVQFQSDQERLLSQMGELRKQKIALCRVIGLPLDVELEVDTLEEQHQPTGTDIARAMRRALENRPDLHAAETQVTAAAHALAAAHSQYLPSITGSGYYGVIGPRPDKNHGVLNATVSLNIPIFDGGRTRGDVQQAETTLKQRRAELEDQRSRVEQEIRNALIDQETASGQLHLAERNREVAHQSLDQAKDRFLNGVTSTVEVVQAQEGVAAAESTYINSLFSLKLSELSLARAEGQLEAAVSASSSASP